MSSAQTQYEAGALPSAGELRGIFLASDAPASRVLPASAVTRWVSVVLLFAMSVTVVALLWFPVKRSFSYQEVNFNEGWNVYKQEMAAHGVPLYGGLTQHFTGYTGYPPLSFHLVGWLGERMGSYTQAGRRIALVSLLATAVILALTIRQITGNTTAAVFSLLTYLLGVLLLMPDRVGGNDPQFPAEALAAAGIYFYLRGSRCARLLCLSALALSVGGFYKHSIIAVPLAIGLDLLLHSLRPGQPTSGLLRPWKSFVIWTAALLGFCAVFTAATIAVDGPYFLRNMTGGRAYLYLSGLKNIHSYLSLVQVPLLLACAWCFYTRRPKRSAIFTLLLVTHAVAFYFSGGDGVDLNIFYDAWYAVALACGMALAELDFGSPELVPALRKPWVPALAMLALFASMLGNIPRNTYYQYKQAQFVESDEREFHAAVEQLRRTPGEALCESLLLCYEAGRAYDFDPYHVSGMYNMGRLHESEIVGLLRARRWKVIQLSLNPEDQGNIASANDALAFKIGGYFRPSEIAALLGNYRLAMHTRKMLIFVPKAEPSSNSERG